MSEANKPVTIKDVAEAAGVSLGSVSNVINGTANTSDRMREQVLGAAAALGFEINHVAQTLRRRRSGTISLCTISATSQYMRELAHELDAIASSNGYELLQAYSQQDPSRELHRIRTLLQSQTDGIIFLPGLSPQASLEALAATGKPTVVIDRLCDDRRFNYVVADNRNAMRELVRLFLALGHRDLLFIPQNMHVITTQHRLEGIAGEAAASDGKLRFHAVEKPDTAPALDAMIEDLLARPRPPTGIIAGNSRVAISVIEALKRINFTIPADVSFAMFDDPEWAVLPAAPVTTVKSDVKKMAEEAWRLLRVQLEGESKAPQRLFVRSEIVPRASIAPPPPRC